MAQKLRLEERIRRNSTLADQLDEALDMARAQRKRGVKAGVKSAIVAMGLDSFTSPESSSISGASYDHGTRTMTITFWRGPGVEVRYHCGAFPADLFAEFKASNSKGTFFNARIRPFFVLDQVSGG